MNSVMLQSLVSLARVPDSNPGAWAENAETSVRLLAEICEANEEIILYASGPHLYVHSVLAPRGAVSPPDHDDLCHAHLQISDSWCIQRVYGGGKDHRVYLESPLSHPGCRTLVDGEKLIFVRSFEGVKTHRSTIELSQKLVHALGLHYMDERNAYCRLDSLGEFEDIISVYDDEHADPWQRVRVVTVRGRDIANYMALSNTSLVTMFDFTRFLPGPFQDGTEVPNAPKKPEISFIDPE